MKRRELLYSLLGVSCLPAFLEAQSASAEDMPPVFSGSSPETVGTAVSAFFSASEFASFRKLAQVMMPADGNEPGAIEAQAPEFLDFLLSQSPTPVQVLYRDGVRELDKRSAGRFKRQFPALEDPEIATVLAPLSEAWTYRGPSEPYAQFLQAAKVAVWQATTNSRQWAEAASGRRRGAAGVNTYWLPFE